MQQQRTNAGNDPDRRHESGKQRNAHKQAPNIDCDGQEQCTETQGMAAYATDGRSLGQNFGNAFGLYSHVHTLSTMHWGRALDPSAYGEQSLGGLNLG